MHARLPFLLLLLIVLLAPLALDAQTSEDDHEHDGEYARCLTPIRMEMLANPEKHDSKLFNAAFFCGDRTPRQFTMLSNEGHFRIHYDKTGDHRVPAADRAPQNDVPDYIDSMAYYLEYAWRIEVEVYGYEPPAPDSRGPGPEIDVYVCDIDEGFYGGATPEMSNVVGQEPLRVSGYLELDNDYAESNYRSKGIAGVKVTTAHELHHIIQFSAYRAELSQSSLYEATSTWFEREVHPEIKDYIQYVNEFLKSPQEHGFATNNTSTSATGYAHSLYLIYLSKKLNRDVVREIWEQFMSKESFDAIDAVLRRYGLNLENSFCEFAKWCYYTGYRAQDTSYFPDARSYMAMKPAMTRLLTEGEETFDDGLYPLGFGLYQLAVGTSGVPTRDTVDFLITNARSDVGAGGRQLTKEPFQLIVSADQRSEYTEFTRTGGSIYYKLVAPNRFFCLDAGNVTLAARISPQPFINDGAAQLLISVGQNIENIRTAKVWLYSSALTRVREIEQNGLLPLFNQLGILWDGRDNNGELVPSGIYIYELSINNATPILGKIAVIRR